MESPESESEAQGSGSDSEDARPAKMTKKGTEKAPAKAKPKSAAAVKPPKGEVSLTSLNRYLVVADVCLHVQEKGSGSQEGS